MKSRDTATVLLAVALAMLVPALVRAQAKTENAVAAARVTSTCDLTAYKNETQSFSPPLPIPDFNEVGVTLGPLATGHDGTALLDVVLELEANHTWIGDLSATLGYDLDCDGTVDVSDVVLCRPGRLTCSGGTGFGCSGDLSCPESYLLSDASPDGLGLDAACTTTIAGGCYHPSGAGAGPLSVFAGLPKGGCWYLNVADHEPGDVGSICRWTVHTLNDATAARLASWGELKLRYR